MSEHWSVSVERNGENIVTIESDSLFGRELSSADEETIRTAAFHLLAFLGDCDNCGSRVYQCKHWKAIGHIACCPECSHDWTFGRILAAEAERFKP